MKRLLRQTLVWLGVVMVVIGAQPLRALAMQEESALTAERIEDRHIRAAMDAIVRELYERKDSQHFWDPPAFESEFLSRQAGGYTALVCLSLMYAGESYQDPRLRDAIAHLEKLRMGGTYAVSVRANLWAMLPPPFGELLLKDKDWLIQGFSDRAAGWNYEQEPYTARRDNSITQYGALALWEAAKRDLRIDNRYWRMMEDRFLSMQLADGGWNYSGEGPATGSMTTAGLTVLFITQDYLHAPEQVDLRRAGPTNAERAIAAGMQWMDRNFSGETNPGRDTDFYYYLYGVERVGLASGYKFFGGKDWYREGAAELIRRLCEWNEATGTMRVHRTLAGNPRAGDLRTVDLAFSLMFLSRGRVPVAINKLRLDGGRWNNRPRDVANLTARIGQVSEEALNWQIVDFSAPPETWLDAPLLYYTSDETPAWIAAHEAAAEEFITSARDFRTRLTTGLARAEDAPVLANAAELQKLRRYLDLGGMLFVNVDGGNRAVARAWEMAGRLMYPHLEWRTLPADHWAYTLYTPVMGNRPELRALSNGVRELLILSPSSDFGESFQARQFRRTQDWETLTNLYLYASERGRSRPRLEPHALRRGERGTTMNASVMVARAIHAGAWDAEPLAMDVFRSWAWNETGLDVRVVDQPLGSLDEIVDEVALVVLSGTENHDFTDQEQQALRAYIAGGGRVLIETTGGCGTFTESVEALARSWFEAAPRSMRRDAAITGATLPGGQSLQRVEYRPYAFERFGARETAPRLRGVNLSEGGTVYFSREDLLQGVLDQPSWGISGYAPRDARRLLLQIILAGPPQ